MKWNNILYDQKHDFVSEYGKVVVKLLQPEVGEKILDLGCGTGDLTGQIAKLGSEVIGIDGSAEMISEAEKKFSDIRFCVGDIRSMDLKSVGIEEEGLEAVFSNAVLHWVKKEEQSKVLGRVNSYLKMGGRFVAECGGRGNVVKIRKAIHEVLLKQGYKKQAEMQKWYFPSVAEYAGLLEKHGFEIQRIGTYDRPTVLKSTESGIVDWLEMFAGTFFEGISADNKKKLLYEIQEMLKGDLYQKGEWIADYKRLRFSAVKKKGITK